MQENKNNPTSTILTIVVGFLIVFLITKWNWALYVSITIGALGLISSTLAHYISTGWMKIGWLMGLIIPNILLSLVYFLILTPVAILSRIISKKDSLSLTNPKGSLFTERNKSFDKTSFEKPW